MHDRWFSQRAVLLHLAVVVWVPGCLVAAWWQVNVAMSGNTLGWAYAVEWPIFSILGVVAWWQLLHDDPETVGAKGLERARQVAEAQAGASVSGVPASGEAACGAAASGVRAQRSGAGHGEQWDEELAAYNAYLAALDEKGTSKTWRNPTGACQR